MVLASGVISGDVSSSFEATGFGLPFHLRGEHNPTTGGCNAVGCKHKRRRQGAIAQCSYCEHAYHACCLSPNDSSAALESSTISWACADCTAKDSQAANVFVFADGEQHAALQHATQRYLR